MHINTCAYASRRTHVHTFVSFKLMPSGRHAVPNISLAHSHFVLPPASPEFCLPTWCLYQQVEQLAGPSTLEVLGHRLDVWVIKSACGAQHAAHPLPISVCVCSLTERAQLLKNVFKKSTVSLYRSDSMQQNLLRKLHNIFLSSSLSLFLYLLLPFLQNMPQDGGTRPGRKRFQFIHVRFTCVQICSLVRGTDRAPLFLL